MFHHVLITVIDLFQITQGNKFLIYKVLGTGLCPHPQVKSLSAGLNQLEEGHRVQSPECHF